MSPFTPSPNAAVSQARQALRQAVQQGEAQARALEALRELLGDFARASVRLHRRQQGALARLQRELDALGRQVRRMAQARA